MKEVEMLMAPKNGGSVKIELNKRAWTTEEDQKLSQHIQIHGRRGANLFHLKKVLVRFQNIH